MTKKKICLIITASIAAISAAIFFIRRRLINRHSAFAVLAALVVCMTFATVLSATAYAKGGEDEENGGENAEYSQDYQPGNLEPEITITIPALPTDPITEQEPEEPEQEQSGQTLTPPGNLNLVDDFSVDNDHDMQFITVVTRNGHFFYIIIDRSTDRFNVHFLNQVSEYYLWEILEEEARRSTAPAPVEPLPEVIPDPEPEPEPEESGGGIGGLLIMLLLIGAIGGGAYYYFKVLKPGQSTAKAAATNIDEFVFDDDEDDFGNPIGEFDGAFDGGDYTEANEGAEHSGAEFEDDMPDFTATDFGEETPESEDK